MSRTDSHAGSLRREEAARLRDLLREYDEGPYPAARLLPVPEELVAVFEARSGKQFPLEVVVAYERARAFVGYAGLDLATPLTAPATPAPGAAHPQRRPDGIDPTDLGD